MGKDIGNNLLGIHKLYENGGNSNKVSIFGWIKLPRTVWNMIMVTSSVQLFK